MKKSILYLVDDAMCLSVFEEMFDREFDVRVALTATEARRMLAERGADIVFSDQMMPDTRGTEFLREVAATTGRDKSYRVLLTGSAVVGSVLAEITSGVIHTFITKPWTEDGIRRVLERAELNQLEPAPLRDSLPGGVSRSFEARAFSSHR